MAVIVTTNNPSALLDHIREEIDKRGIRTWIYEEENPRAFFHTPRQWTCRGRFHAESGVRCSPYRDAACTVLRFTFTDITEGRDSLEDRQHAYDTFHDRFIEMLRDHGAEHCIGEPERDAADRPER